ncbi:hypothetical protein pb186bvf_008390 [Paramecium bursaria]
MEGAISQENLQILLEKLPKRGKSQDDIKLIYNIVRQTAFFSNLFDQYEQSVNNDGIQRICELIKIENYKLNQVILKEGDLTNHKMYLIVKGKTAIYKKGQSDDFTTQYLTYINVGNVPLENDYGRLVNVLHIGEQFGEKATFHKDNITKRTASVVSVDQSTCLVMVKSQFDEVFKMFGQLFQDKYQTLCKLIQGLKDMSSKRMMDIIISQFEDLKIPVSGHITIQDDVGEYLYFLSQGIVSMYYNNQYICDVDSQGVFGDELLEDPDDEPKPVLTYFYTTQVKSAYAIIYRIKVKVFQKLFPNRIIRFLIKQLYQKQVIREQIIVSQKKSKISTEPQPVVVVRKAETKQEIKQQGDIDEAFQTYQIPKHTKVLKFNKKKLDLIYKHQKIVNKKITINQFIELSKKESISQMALLQKVENPYDFASNVNSDGFLKQYYANLIREGLVKPHSIQGERNSDTIYRHRIKSAIRLVEKKNQSPKRIKTKKRAQSQIEIEPVIQITAYQSQSDTQSLFFQTPRPASKQSNIQTYSSPTRTITVNKVSTPITRTGSPKSYMFRPLSGFMDHSSRLSQCSEINKRIRRPNQF